jgi:hypothetical protein
MYGTCTVLKKKKLLITLHIELFFAVVILLLQQLRRVLKSFLKKGVVYCRGVPRILPGGCIFLADLPPPPPHNQSFRLRRGRCTGRGGCTCILCIPPGYAPGVLYVVD